MTDIPKKIATSNLRIEQIAILCGVSEARVHSWIEKNGLKYIIVRGEKRVRQDDLVTFLMQYNMPIPAGVLPMNARKILFICPSKRGKSAGDQFFRLFCKQFCRKSNCCIDRATYGKGAEYKILSFLPDLILADAVSGDEEALNLMSFVKNIGGIRTIALVRRKLTQARRERILSAGAHAVVERYSPWDDLLACFNSVFTSPGNTHSQ